MSDYLELPLTGAEPPLSDTEKAIQETTHRFAAEVMRPAGIALDKMDPAEAIAPGSLYWEVMEKAKGLGLSLVAMADMDPTERARVLAIACEELAWGDVGLACSVLVNHFPVMFSLLAGNQAMAEYCDGKRGCWSITEADHGSDMLEGNASLQAVNGSYGKPNCVARIEGDKVIINGQKSAWCSGAMTAEVCVLYCHANVDGEVKPGICVIVPLDLPGVSRGKPLDKIGMRGCNQGELYFEQVEVPLSHLLAGPDTYAALTHATLTEANPHVAATWVGVGRAAYEHALAYAHERKQGGLPIIQHQQVRYRLFHMFRKVEAARALVRRVVEFNATAPTAALQASIAAKITATQNSFEVASDAIQIFGGNGVTREYPMEKLLRDARAGMIADGCNEVLAIKGGGALVNPDWL
ncbi:MAG: acyl-CoA dehydrogenase [Halieaceae bacterium]|jgi:alkylation response protein AidB-like acyl-CoA dehydrogenase|nr:acyl-CoA dehydrogenase [Halieaceae bacterium]